MSDEYEIVSRQELHALRREVQELKARPTQPPSADLLQAIDRLSHQIKHLVAVFERANKDIVEVPQERVGLPPVASKNDKTDKLDLVIAQNDQLAEGMVHLSDLLVQQSSSVPSSSELPSVPSLTPIPSSSELPSVPSLTPVPSPASPATTTPPKHNEALLERFMHPDKQESFEMPDMPYREGLIDSAPRVDDEVFSSVSMQLMGQQKDELTPPPFPRRARDEDNTGLGTISDQDRNLPQPTLPVPVPAENDLLEPPPAPADEQMPSLPPPPSLEEAMKSAPVPTTPMTKRSRKSLINSFR